MQLGDIGGGAFGLADCRLGELTQGLLAAGNRQAQN
jgi:hypothetical protein